jgi:hypothetical protein
VKLRIPLAASVVFVGLAVGALIVGRPSAVANDLVLDPPAAPGATSAPAAPSTTDITVPVTVPDPAAGVDFGVSVVLANASAVTGIAEPNAEALVALGFDATAVDIESSDVSVVYARPGTERTAEYIADILGLGRGVVEPFPSDPVTLDDEAADVIVVIANDRVTAP